MLAEENGALLVERHAEELKIFETRILIMDRRAEAAEQRAADLTAWLVRYYDQIVAGFQAVRKDDLKTESTSGDESGAVSEAYR